MSHRKKKEQQVGCKNKKILLIEAYIVCIKTQESQLKIVQTNKKLATESQRIMTKAIEYLSIMKSHLQKYIGKNGNISKPKGNSYYIILKS